MKNLFCDAQDSRCAFANVTMICDSALLRTYNITVHRYGSHSKARCHHSTTLSTVHRGRQATNAARTEFCYCSVKYCDQHVCIMSVRPLTYHRNQTSKCHQIFCTCYVCLWLGCPQCTGLHSSSFVDDVMFSHNTASGQNERRHISTSSPGDSTSRTSDDIKTVWLSSLSGGPGWSLPSRTAVFFFVDGYFSLLW